MTLIYLDDFQYIQETTDKPLLTTKDINTIIKAVSIE